MTPNINEKMKPPKGLLRTKTIRKGTKANQAKKPKSKFGNASTSIAADIGTSNKSFRYG